ncbi:MAG: site-specific DNA-methyltransferase [Hyphomicrobiales bacterium]
MRDFQFRGMRIRYRRIDTLRPYQNNPNLHSPKQIKKLVRSLQEFGWVVPLIIDENGMVLCGHGRLLAAIELGLEEVPTIQILDMSEAQKRAYVTADNRLAQDAKWSRKLLRTEMQGLIDMGFEVEITGFDTLEIDEILTISDEEPGEDIVHLPEIDEPVCRPDDLWDVGSHRMLCGDSRLPENVARVLAGEQIQLFLTDPPFNCAIINNVSRKHGNFLMGAAEMPMEEFAQTLLRPAFEAMAAHSSPGAIAFVFCDWRSAPFFLQAANGVFEEVKNMIVWAKTNASLGGFYRSAHELIYAFKVTKGKNINNFGLRHHRCNVWTYPGANVFRAGRLQDLADHPTVKNKFMCADAILDTSRRNGIVFDSFAGAGTTLVAAAMTGRRGYGIELDPKYCDVILRRLSEEVGSPPLLEGQHPFAEVAAARRKERAA